jgi:hypothetical protein
MMAYGLVVALIEQARMLLRYYSDIQSLSLSLSLSLPLPSLHVVLLRLILFTFLFLVVLFNCFFLAVEPLIVLVAVI